MYPATRPRLHFSLLPGSTRIKPYLFTRPVDATAYGQDTEAFQEESSYVFKTQQAAEAAAYKRAKRDLVSSLLKRQEDLKKAADAAGQAAGQAAAQAPQPPPQAPQPPPQAPQPPPSAPPAPHHKRWSSFGDSPKVKAQLEKVAGTPPQAPQPPPPAPPVPEQQRAATPPSPQGQTPPPEGDVIVHPLPQGMPPIVLKDWTHDRFRDMFGKDLTKKEVEIYTGYVKAKLPIRFPGESTKTGGANPANILLVLRERAKNEEWQEVVDKMQENYNEYLGKKIAEYEGWKTKAKKGGKKVAQRVGTSAGV